MAKPGSPRRLGLIGITGHWRHYAAALRALPGLVVSAVAVAAPEERLTRFDELPGVTPETRRCASPVELLDCGEVDVVQVCTRPDLIGTWVYAAVERGLPVMAEKPIAPTLDQLHAIYALARRRAVLVSALHTQRARPALAATRDAIRNGAIGVPLLAHSQKSYVWETTERRARALGGGAEGPDTERRARALGGGAEGPRPDFLRTRETFPGIAPYIGIHVFDWLVWLLGDRFLDVTGGESAAARPDYAACASQAAYVLRLTGGGMATVTLDYLRPAAASTHGEARVRVAGTAGIVEANLDSGEAALIDDSGTHPLPLPPVVGTGAWYARFIRAAGGEGQPLVPLWEACRATEIALKAQIAADTGQPVDLGESPYTQSQGEV